MIHRSCPLSRSFDEPTAISRIAGHRPSGALAHESHCRSLDGTPSSSAPGSRDWRRRRSSESAGWEVSILEARTRPGGRVYTLREPFSDGLYAEAGAARIQDTHEYTLRYVKRFNLTLDPFRPTEGKSVTCIGGRRIVSPQGRPSTSQQVPFDFSAEERKLGLRGGSVKYLFSQMDAIGDPTSPGWPSQDHSRFEIPIAELCRRNGASPAFIRMVALGHDLRGMSALHFLRDSVLGAKTRMWFKIRGGNDRLPAGWRRRSPTGSAMVHRSCDCSRVIHRFT